MNRKLFIYEDCQKDIFMVREELTPDDCYCDICTGQSELIGLMSLEDFKIYLIDSGFTLEIRKKLTKEFKNELLQNS